MTVHVPRRRPAPLDVVVEVHGGATVERLRAALADHLRMPVAGLAVAGRALPDESLVGHPPLLDGVSVAVLGAPGATDPAAGGAGDRPRPVLSLVCVGGPDAGRSHPLEPPGPEVGRSPQRGLSLADPSLSRSHARVDVGADGVFVTDLGSTNGVSVDGKAIDGRVAIDTGSTVVIGASTLRLRRAPGPGTPVVHPGDGTVLVSPGCTPAPDVPEVRVDAPPHPPEPPRARIPWVAALAPVPVVAVLAVLLGPHLLAFALIGPVALLATGLADRVGARTRRARDLADHAAATLLARRRFEDAVAHECRARLGAHPDPDETLRRAEHRLPGLWSGPGDLVVRLGLGDVPSRARWAEGGVVTPGTARRVPVVADLEDVRCLGVTGPPERTTPVLAAVLGQLLVRSPPARLRLRHHGVCSAAGGPRPWSDLVPHVTGSGRPVLAVEDTAGVPGAPALVGETLAAGGVAVLAARTRDELPDGCAAVLETTPGGGGVLHQPGGAVRLVVDGVGAAWRDRLARALAPLRESGSAGGPLPATVDLPDLGPAPLTTEAVLARWAADRGPVAAVGVDAGGTHVIDLVADGPHVLVGGTTGSGKSEFLRTLVTGLALESAPADVTVLLVDFKGGAAFGPCASLPHVVGLVTDLDEHLVGRVLRSLTAEVRRRERLLAEVGASDLADHRSRPGLEPLPRLVVVVDELRTLVDELPDFVHGLVRLAAQGRSLGIHLVLATQRPSGAITPEVHANVNLRIAFRVRDRADSVSVVDDPAAAELPPDTPGRAVARGGDGVLRTFQTALVRPARPCGPTVAIRGSAGGAPSTGSGPDDRAAETAAVVAVVAAAHRRSGGAPPRRAWLPPLPGLVSPESVGPGGFGLVDDPDRQRRTPLTWTPSVPVWRVVGTPRTGRSTALRALVVAAAGTLPRSALHVHVLARGDEHDDLDALPHLGTLARLDDQAAVRALVAHLDALTRRGPAPGQGSTTVTTLLVVDGWDRVTDLDDPHDPTPVSHDLLRIARDGAACGLVVAVSGGRELLRSTWSALGGEVLALTPLDPLDTALLGLPVGLAATTGRPGRAVRAGDGLEVQLARPGGADVAAVAAAADPHDGPPPWRFRPLPARVRREDVRPVAADGTPALPLGIAGPTGEPWAWVPAAHGRRLLVAGAPGSGRSSTLDVLARSAADAGHPVLVVRGRSGSPRSCPDGSWPVVRPEDLDALVALRQDHPDLLVLVDDADRLDGAPTLPALTEIADLADRDGGAVAVATTTSALRTRFRGLDVDAAHHRLGLLLQPDPGDGDVVGIRRLAVTAPAPAGRGVLVIGGAPTPIQVIDPAG